MKPEEHIKFFTEEELATEIWKEIPEYEGKYEISTLGRIRSIPRYSNGRSGLPVFKRMIYLKIFMDKKGYLKITLQNGYLTRQWFVHKLVLKTFVRDRTEEEQCRHLDGNKLNNKLTNICWGTAKENAEDRRQHGTMLMGETGTNAKLTNIAVKDIRYLFNIENKSIKYISIKFNITPSHISSILRNKHFKDNKYIQLRDTAERIVFSKCLAKEIRKLYNVDGISMAELARVYNCCESNIARIIRNEYYYDPEYKRTRFINDEVERKKEQAQNIRDMAKNGISRKELCERFNLTDQTVYRILTNKMYKNVR